MLATAWMVSAIGVMTRILKDIHFSIVMFYYSFIASMALMTCLAIEFLYWSDNFNDGMRMFTYDMD